MGKEEAEPGAPLLSYVERETRSDISVLWDGNVTRVVAPRKPWWQILFDWKWLIPAWAGVYLQAALSEGSIGLVRGTLAAVAGPVALVYQCFTLWRRRIFEVTPEEVRVGYVRGTNPIWEDRWPRRAVGEIRVNRFEGPLLIRITGQDLKEYRISRDRSATEAVAAALQSALEGYDP